METEGYFYKWIGGEWHYGRKIYFPDGRILDWELRDTYEYPYEGWVWYKERPELNILGESEEFEINID